MCTTSTGADCSAAGFQALATQSGSFGCAIVSQWTPVITPPQWDEITNGVQLTVQNGDACPDGTNRGIQIQFTCGSAIGPATFSAAEPVTCQYEWAFPTTAACTGATPPAPTPPTPTTPCVLAPGVEYTATPMRVLSNVGNAEACCDVCKTTANCTAWTVRNASQWTCSLYSSQFAAKAKEAVLMSGHIVGAATHYQDPFAHACLPGELNLTVANLLGRWCSSACDKTTACPLDVPTNVTAKPACEIHDPVGSGMHCALVCASDAECGPTNKSVCDDTFTPGICTYEL